MGKKFVKLDSYDKRIIQNICEKCSCTNKIELEDYATVEYLLELLDEANTHIEHLEEKYEELEHSISNPEDYDPRPDMYYEEQRLLDL